MSLRNVKVGSKLIMPVHMDKSNVYEYAAGICVETNDRWVRFEFKFPLGTITECYCVNGPIRVTGE